MPPIMRRAVLLLRRAAPPPTHLNDLSCQAHTLVCALSCVAPEPSDGAHKQCLHTMNRTEGFLLCNASTSLRSSCWVSWAYKHSTAECYDQPQQTYTKIKQVPHLLPTWMGMTASIAAIPQTAGTKPSSNDTISNTMAASRGPAHTNSQKLMPSSKRRTSLLQKCKPTTSQQNGTSEGAFDISVIRCARRHDRHEADSCAMHQLQHTPHCTSVHTVSNPCMQSLVPLHQAVASRLPLPQYMHSTLQCSAALT